MKHEVFVFDATAERKWMKNLSMVYFDLCGQFRLPHKTIYVVNVMPFWHRQENMSATINEINYFVNKILKKLWKMLITISKSPKWRRQIAYFFKTTFKP